MKVLLDSNVIIAAVATQGLCRAVFRRCLLQHTLVFSEGLLEEVTRSLLKKDIITEPIGSRLAAFLRAHGLLGTPSVIPASACRDPKDLPILGLAVAARCDFLVTGDRDLLVLRSYQGIPIVTPRDFWARTPPPVEGSAESGRIPFLE